jgi:GxxExxY protein
LEYEFNKNNIPHEREKVYFINYKNTILKHQFYTNFVLYNSIILEIKTVDYFNNSHYNQCLNYLKVSDNELPLLVNFNSVSLEYKRIVRTKK